MTTLLYKEIRLAAHPTSIVFIFLGCLVLVPAYPYSVIFMFGCLAPYITFLNARETNDAWYTAILPVTKRESVLGKCLLIASFQLFQLLFSIPFAFLRSALNIENNPVGLDATLAWYGLGLAVYAVFDFVFIVLWGWGTAGAALATSFGFFCSTLYYLFCLVRAERSGNRLIALFVR